jgi:transposase
MAKRKEIKRLRDIITHFANGMSYKEVAHLYGRKERTVKRWVKLLRRGGYSVPISRGRKKLEL